MHILRNLHTVHRHVQRNIRQLPQPPSTEPRQPNDPISAALGIFHCVDDIFRVPAPGNGHHQIPRLQVPPELEPEHLLEADVIGHRHHRGHIVVEAEEVEFLLSVLRDPFIKVVLEMRGRRRTSPVAEDVNGVPVLKGLQQQVQRLDRKSVV